LISLKGCPEKVGAFYVAQCSKLKSLEYGPTDVGGYYNVWDCDLRSLKGAPKEVGLNPVMRLPDNQEVIFHVMITNI